MEAVREKKRLVYRDGSRDFKSSFKCRELDYVIVKSYRGVGMRWRNEE